MFEKSPKDIQVGAFTLEDNYLVYLELA